MSLSGNKGHEMYKKSVMLVQSCSFAILNLLLFAFRRRRCKKLPVVVIHKFCYHGNVTSHFSYILRAVEKLKYLRLCSHFTGQLLRRYESHTDKASVHTKNGDFGVIYVTERSYAAPISKVESHTIWCSFDTGECFVSSTKSYSVWSEPNLKLQLPKLTKNICIYRLII